MSDQSKAVVVNSLLCFINNFRQHSQIEKLIDQYFNTSMHLEAVLLIKTLLANTKSSFDGLHSKQPKASLLYLFDELISSSQVPIFAADNLHVLPMVVLEQEDIGADRLLLQEIRQLRLLLQNCHVRSGLETISACTSNTTSSCNSATKTRIDLSRIHSSSLHANNNHLNTPVKQVEEVCNGQISLATASGMCLTSTPMIPSQCSQPLTLLATSFNTVSTPTKRVSNSGGRRLDQAVRKLTDRLEARLDTTNCSGEGHEDRATPSHSHNTSTTSAASNDAAVNDQNSDDDYYYYSTHDNQTENSAQPTETKLAMNKSSMVLPNSSANKEANAEETDGEDEQDDINRISSLAKQQLDTRNKRKPKKSLQNLSITSCNASSAPPSSNGLQFDSADLSEDDELSFPPSESSSMMAKDEIRGTKDSTPSNDDDGTEKPFSCSHVNCHKKFTNKFLLKKHQFIHTGLRPHACPFCNKRFNRKDNLLRHKKTHLANALLQQDGGRKRHNMLYGVSQEDAGLDVFSTLDQSMSKKKKRKSSTKPHINSVDMENANDKKCEIKAESLVENLEMACL